MPQQKVSTRVENSTELTDASQPSKRSYTLKPVTTPVEKPTSLGAPEAESAPKQPPSSNDPFVRAANEDDDGYDPFSDRPEERPLFEKNPWD